jgi:hypothetical protein
MGAIIVAPSAKGRDSLRAYATANAAKPTTGMYPPHAR